MDVSHLLDGLNDAQREAVASPLGSALVLAGAGSGKTRVLMHRIAWLIQAEGASPHSILAVTFTNKAAAEMRGRVETCSDIPSGGLWIGTFHGLAHRLLRLHWREAGLPQGFQILDSEDQLRLIKKVLKALNLDESRWVPREVQWFINSHKDEGVRPKHIKDDGRPDPAPVHQALSAPTKRPAQRAGVVDFAELLLRAFELWRDNPALLHHYRTRFRHVSGRRIPGHQLHPVCWLTLLVGRKGCPSRSATTISRSTAGAARGSRTCTSSAATTRKAALCRLEQNYRSTGAILDAANALITNNSGRLGKTLWTSGADGEPVQLYAAFNERDEADFVVHRIREWVAHGGLRTRNRHSVPLERAIARVRRGVH